MIERLREIILDYVEADPEQITESTSLRNDIGATSFDLMNIAMAVEEEYQVSLPDSLLPKIKTVGDLIALLSEE
ncbi:MAG: acyl carrier protein [Clostridia bacterium]|nr:acyl carrier protein [Clostridia bacterium]MBQ9880370.1 acyl carrier protein [Clostridia bacterium]